MIALIAVGIISPYCNIMIADQGIVCFGIVDIRSKGENAVLQFDPGMRTGCVNNRSYGGFLGMIIESVRSRIRFHKSPCGDRISYGRVLIHSLSRERAFENRRCVDVGDCYFESSGCAFVARVCGRYGNRMHAHIGLRAGSTGKCSGGLIKRHP